jgi:hypothetical protein
VFGWIKQRGGLRQFKLRGSKKDSAVWSLRDRLQLDPLEQPAEYGDGSGALLAKQSFLSRLQYLIVHI